MKKYEDQDTDTDSNGRKPTEINFFLGESSNGCIYELLVED